MGRKQVFIQKSVSFRNSKSKTRELEQAKGEEMTTDSRHWKYLKKSLDILISLAVLVILAPVFFLISLAIRIESGGNIFYVSKRAGKGYRIFNFYKFRTMYPDAEKRRAEFAHLNQYRIRNGQLF